MKKHLILAVLLIVSIVLAAQTGSDKTITGVSKIKKEQTPQAVIDTLNKRFPDAKSVQYYKIPKDAAQKGWQITEEDNLEGDEVDYYTISFKRDDMKYYGLYNKDGKLLKSKAEAKVGTLPDPIVTSLKSLSAQYPGYKVTSKTYYKNQNYSKSEEYFEVIAENGKSKKTLIYDKNGGLVKVKD
jgi:hypothetical protein